MSPTPPCRNCGSFDCRVDFWRQVVQTGEWHGRARDAADAACELDSAMMLCDLVNSRVTGTPYEPVFDDDDGLDEDE